MNVIPSLSNMDPDSISDPDWPEVGCTKSIIEGHDKLRKCRQFLGDLYHEEFMSNLMHQATNQKQRYKKVKHDALVRGDVVLLKEPLCKPTKYPMATVVDVVHNDLNEVTQVTVRKGNTREIVSRHVTSVIPLFSPEKDTDPINDPMESMNKDNCSSKLSRPARKAALKGRKKTAELILQNAI